MYIQTNIKGNNVTHLLREDRREGKKIIKKTFANLSALEQDHIVILKEMLKGNDVILRDDVFEHIKIENVLPWGHVEAVLKTIKKIDLAKVIDPCPSPERNIILGLVASRVIQPESKLSTKNTWINPALARELKIEDADEQDIYKAMDWLVDNQLFIEKRLADRHLNENDFIFSDASSSNYEGRHKNDELGPLIHFGYSRDKKGGKRQVNYMLLTGEQGRPISIEAFPGNTSDAQILLPTFDKIKDAFGLKKVVLVADRGMITQESINILKQTNDVDYVSALRSTSIKDLIKKGYIERGLFDEQNLYEFTALDEYPGERLVVCLNFVLKAKREEERNKLIEMIRKRLDKIKTRVKNGQLKKKEDIAFSLGIAIDKNKMRKYFILNFEDNYFDYSLDKKRIFEDQMVDGINVLRTSLSEEVLSAEDCVRIYKNLGVVENAFRTMKTDDSKIGPIYHRLDGRIKAHLFLIMLAYYVEWHMRQAWKELTFSETNLEELKKTGHPVRTAERSKETTKKEVKKIVDIDDIEYNVTRFRDILNHLSAISDVQFVLKAQKANQSDIYSNKITNYSPLQTLALKLIDKIPRYPKDPRK